MRLQFPYLPVPDGLRAEGVVSRQLIGSFPGVDSAVDALIWEDSVPESPVVSLVRTIAYCVEATANATPDGVPSVPSQYAPITMPVDWRGVTGVLPSAGRLDERREPLGPAPLQPGEPFPVRHPVHGGMYNTPPGGPVRPAPVRRGPGWHSGREGWFEDLGPGGGGGPTPEHPGPPTPVDLRVAPVTRGHDAQDVAGAHALRAGSAPPLTLPTEVAEAIMRLASSYGMISAQDLRIVQSYESGRGRFHAARFHAGPYGSTPASSAQPQHVRERRPRGRPSADSPPTMGPLRPPAPSRGDRGEGDGGAAGGGLW